MAIRTVVAAESDGPRILRADLCEDKVLGNDCVSPEGSGIGCERQLDPSNLTVRLPHQYFI